VAAGTRSTAFIIIIINHILVNVSVISSIVGSVRGSD
jgi:hypothetical protein